MRLRRASVSAVLIGLSSLGLVPIAMADVVNILPGSTFKAPGNAVRGLVQSESPTEVVVKLGNTMQKVPTGAIASITYDGHPSEIDLAQSRENAGAYADAAARYLEAATKAAGKPFIQESALFGQARAVTDLALTDPSRTADAVKLLDAFVKAHPNGRHVVPALDVLAKLQLAQGDYAKVDDTLARMDKLPESADRATVLRAKVFSRKGDFAKAASELDTIIKGAPEGSIRKRDAQLAKSEVLVGMKKFAEAETLVQGVIKSAPPEDSATQALAHNTLGDCLRAAGKPRDALYAYLHTDLLFSKDKEQHPKALARIAELWRELKQDDRATEVSDRLRKDYPRSPYAATAAK